jgi:hypothetical protein
MYDIYVALYVNYIVWPYNNKYVIINRHYNVIYYIPNHNRHILWFIFPSIYFFSLFELL